MLIQSLKTMEHSTFKSIRSTVFFLITLSFIQFHCTRQIPIVDEISLTPKEQLGKLLFFEEGLSTPEGQSCATCHDPAVAFADPSKELPVSKGAVHGLYGSRNDMPVSYSMYVPPLHFDSAEQVWKGGLFWDGRASSLTEQAMGPPLNPLEMANADTAALAERIRMLSYSDRFEPIYGKDALENPDSVFFCMADALAAYERSAEVNPFSSKFDLWQRGESTLTEQEQRGFMLFVVESKGNCAACHPHTSSDDKIPALFTDFTYDNLGVPPNAENPYYLLSEEHNPEGFAFRDPGLAETLDDPAELGKFRVPTLRNVALTSPYFHNGVFKTLYQVVAFYNTRDVAPWQGPEIADHVNMDEMGNLGLSNQEVEDLVAFLNTLTDGWTASE